MIALITRRRRQILVHSFIYYRLGTSIIMDATYDRWARELYRLQIDNPNESRAAEFYDAFTNFDPATGFDLPWMPWIETVATQLIEYDRRQDGKTRV